MLRILLSIVTLSAAFLTGFQNDLKPTVILISIDGYRADYFDRYPSPTIQMLAKGGVRAKWMTPAFPTLTFPNHYTIVTGLDPQSHGITSNTIYDRDSQRTFAISKREEVTDSRWWLGEPIWVTAEKQGQKAGTLFWVGCEAAIEGVRPSYFQKFNDEVPATERVDTVLKWLDLPVDQRPTFLTVYFSDVDHAGHSSGPDSTDVRDAIDKVDAAIARLVDGLKTRSLFDSVNIIIVSDHGMASVDVRQAVVIDEFFTPAQVEKVAWASTLVNIYARPGMEERIYEQLKSKLPFAIKVYRRKDVPQRFHYSHGKRIGDVVVIADEGWLAVSREKPRVPTGPDGKVLLKGFHGYDNRLESMRAAFIGYGPALKHATVVEDFNNRDVYNILAKILKLTPAKNEGGSKGMSLVLGQ